MRAEFVHLLLFAFTVACANVLGGLILFPSAFHSRYKRYLKFLLAIGAGFMLAVSFIEVLPRAVQLWQSPEYLPSAGEHLYVPMLLVLVGYLLTQFFEHTLAPHIHLGEEVHTNHLIKPASAYTAVGGLLIHAFFDGVSIAAAAQIDFKVGILVFVAVFLHKFPEGFTIGSLLIAAGKGVREVFVATAAIGLTTFFGVFAFYFVGASVGFTVAYALPLACGVTLYVAASDLIPEVNHHSGKRPVVSFCVFGGVAMFFGLHLLLHRTLGG